MEYPQVRQQCVVRWASPLRSAQFIAIRVEVLPQSIVDSTRPSVYWVSTLVEYHKVVADDRAFTAHNQTHGNAFGLVMMGAMEEINSTKASTESQG